MSSQIQTQFAVVQVFSICSFHLWVKVSLIYTWRLMIAQNTIRSEFVNLVMLFRKFHPNKTADPQYIVQFVNPSLKILQLTDLGEHSIIVIKRRATNTRTATSWRFSFYR